LLTGCSVSGYLAEGVEVEQGPGLSLLALWLPKVKLCGVRLGAETLDPIDGDLDDINGWVMLADPLRIDTLGLIQRLKRASPGRPMARGQAAGSGREHGGAVFLNDDVFPEGAVAVGIGGPWTISTHVSQGCFPLGEPWTITEVQRNALLGISNRPAVDVLQETLHLLTPEQRELAPGNVMVGLAVDEYLDEYNHGDFMVRGILGVDQKRGAVVIGGLPRVGQTMQFHLRDAARATVDLAAVAQQAAALPGEPLATLLCTCEGRGSRVFGDHHHDSRVVQGELPGVPLAGAFCAGEIGPLGRTIVLHGFTATLAVIRAVDGTVG
jgi:small ligand-binding sensory domain FIST